MGLKLVPITAEQYDDRLNVLPPIQWSNGGFLIGEASSFRVCDVTGVERTTYDGCQQIGDNYYATERSVTVPEWNARVLADAEIVEPENA